MKYPAKTNIKNKNDKERTKIIIISIDNYFTIILLDIANCFHIDFDLTKCIQIN